jgi:hypothetical protein
MKILLATYTHPDFLPPVYEFYSVLQKCGHEVSIICSASEALQSTSNCYTIKTIPNKYGKGTFAKIKYRSAFQEILKQHLQRAELVISFCEVSFLMVENEINSTDTKHFHQALEMSFVSFKDFRRSPLSTFRKMQYLKKLKNCEFVSTPSYERSGWLTAVANLKSPAHTILNCQFISPADEQFIAQKTSTNNNQIITLIHTGGVNQTRSVFELVQAFYNANLANCKLIITNVRDNDYCNSIKKYIADTKSNNITLLGPISRDELIQIQKNADIGVCFMKGGTELDSQMLAPNKIGEYLKYGLAIIATDAPYYDIFGNSFFLVSDLKSETELVSIIQKAVSEYKLKNCSEILKWYNMEYQMRSLLSEIRN